MRVRLETTPIAAGDLPALRNDYLDELPFAQDAFLEALLGNAEYFSLHGRGQMLGYCALGPEGLLLEFFLRRPALYLAQSVFPELVRQRRLRRALIKSFDAVALSCALDLARHVRAVGMLVRDYTPQPLPLFENIDYAVRTATLADLDRVLDVRQQVFTHPGRLAHVIEHGQVLLFEGQRALIGFGILRPVIEGRNEVEVGIAVDVPFRNRGYAAYMLRDLVEHCLEQGWTPISGCSRDNLASIQLGQRIGLCARHRLVEVEF